MSRALIAAMCMAALAACGQIQVTDSLETGHATIAPANLPAFFDCLREKGQTIVEAHRGGNMPGYAENAIETFAHTLATAPAVLEIDIAATKDGQLVLMHDDTVDRTTTGRGAVSDLTLAEFRALSLRDDDGQVLDAHPPTLAAALEWASGKTVLFLDIKRSVRYEDVIAAVRTAHAENRVVMITYTEAQAARVFGLAPDLMISVSIENNSDLDGLLRRGLDPTKLIAWTGVEEPNAALNVVLAQHGIEAMFGTLGGANSWDARFARDGREQYAAFADTGLTLIGTDRFAEAARDLDANDGFEALWGPEQCLSGETWIIEQ